MTSWPLWRHLTCSWQLNLIDRSHDLLLHADWSICTTWPKCGFLIGLYRSDPHYYCHFLREKPWGRGWLLASTLQPARCSQSKFFISARAGTKKIAVLTLSRMLAKTIRHPYCWSMVFDVMRMISTQIRWQDHCWSFGLIKQHQFAYSKFSSTTAVLFRVVDYLKHVTILILCYLQTIPNSFYF